MVHALAAPREELADRGVVAERLKQLHVGATPTTVASIASRTPCSALVSWLTTVSPNTLTYRSIAASSDGRRPHMIDSSAA